jgi:hypothetical protein
MAFHSRSERRVPPLPDATASRAFLLRIAGRDVGEAVFSVLCVLYVGLVAAWISASTFPQLQDYPDWIYQGYLLALKIKGIPEISSVIAVLPYPVPNSLAQVMIAGLCLLMPPLAAGKVTILLYIALASYAVFLATGHRGSWKLRFVLLFLFGLNETFWNGYINYQFAVCCFVIYAALTTRQPDRSPAFHLFWSVAIFFSQFMVFWVFLVYFACRYMLDFTAGSLAGIVRSGFVSLARMPALVLLPSLALSAWYLLGRVFQPQYILAPLDSPDKKLPPGLLSHIEYKIYSWLKLGPFQVFELPGGQVLEPSNHLVYLAGFAVTVVFGAGLAFYLVQFLYHGLRQFRLQRPELDHLQLAVMVLVVLLLFTVAPQYFFGGGNIGERLLIPTLVAMMIVRPPSLSVTNVLAVSSVLCLPVYLAFLANYAASGDQPGGGWHAQFFTHRPYEFEHHAAFLAKPDLDNIPDIGFRTSLIRMIGD